MRGKCSVILIIKVINNIESSFLNSPEQNKLGDTPLHCAAYRGHADIVQLLVNSGARTDIVNRSVVYHLYVHIYPDIVNVYI